MQALYFSMRFKGKNAAVCKLCYYIRDISFCIKRGIMITDDRITSFIKSFMSDNAAEVKAIELKAREEGVPVIRKEAESFLQTMTAIVKPKNILEIGTAVGYSAILMAGAYENSHITTIELDAERASEARNNFEKLNLSERIDLIEGDAGIVLEELSKENRKYDFVFMDAAKGQYMSYWENIIKMIHTGSVILTDNCLQEGSVIHSRSLITQRDRTIYDRMREFLYNITHTEGIKTSIIPIGDGMAISVKE